MKTNAFKKIAYKFFPSLEKQQRIYKTYHNILEIFSKIHYVETEDKILQLIEQYKDVKNNIEATDEKIFKKMIADLDNIVDFTSGIINDPISFSKKLDLKIDQLKPQNFNINKLSLQCACASIIGVLTKDLTPEEKQEQFITQQLRLNVALHGPQENLNIVNYWYSLHWFLRNNKKNSQVFLHKLFQNPKKHDLELIIDQTMYPWLKEKIPESFQQFAQEELMKQIDPNFFRQKIKHTQIEPK